jgi:hypothetical protein
MCHQIVLKENVNAQPAATTSLCGCCTLEEETIINNNTGDDDDAGDDDATFGDEKWVEQLWNGSTVC